MMKFGKLIKYNRRDYAENAAGRLTLNLFLYFKRAKM